MTSDELNDLLVDILEHIEQGNNVTNETEHAAIALAESFGIFIPKVGK